MSDRFTEDLNNVVINDIGKNITDVLDQSIGVAETELNNYTQRVFQDTTNIKNTSTNSLEKGVLNWMERVVETIHAEKKETLEQVSEDMHTYVKSGDYPGIVKDTPRTLKRLYRKLVSKPEKRHKNFILYLEDLQDADGMKKFKKHKGAIKDMIKYGKKILTLDNLDEFETIINAAYKAKTDANRTTAYNDLIKEDLKVTVSGEGKRLLFARYRNSLKNNEYGQIIDTDTAGIQATVAYDDNSLVVDAANTATRATAPTATNPWIFDIKNLNENTKIPISAKDLLGYLATKKVQSLGR